MTPLFVSALTAGTATACLLPIGILIAWWLSRLRRGTLFRVIIETVLLAPVVMPPTVVGYFLLYLLGNGSDIGRGINNLGIHLIFTWQVAAIASFIMAAPLFIRPVVSAFEEIDPDLIECGRTLGATERQIAMKIILPQSRLAIVAGITLGFARALGEFGATMMVAGNIEGRTQTLPLALYSATEGGYEHTAQVYAIYLAIIAFVLNGVITIISDRARNNRR